MKQIAIEKGILMYYGNRAGYAEGRKSLWIRCFGEMN